MAQALAKASPAKSIQAQNVRHTPLKKNLSMQTQIHVNDSLNRSIQPEYVTDTSAKKDLSTQTQTQDNDPSNRTIQPESLSGTSAKKTLSTQKKTRNNDPPNRSTQPEHVRDTSAETTLPTQKQTPVDDLPNRSIQPETRVTSAEETLSTQKQTQEKVPRNRSIQPENLRDTFAKKALSTQKRVKDDDSVPSIDDSVPSIDGMRTIRNERIQCINTTDHEKHDNASKSPSTILTAKSDSDVSTSVKQSTASPNTSLVYRRRGGRMSPRSHELGRVESIGTSFSSESKSPTKHIKRSYHAKKKSAPSVVDDPTYYNVSCQNALFLLLSFSHS
jgi:hypothetical protein